MDVGAFFRVADFDLNGKVNFLEFAAGCLHQSLAPLDDWLLEQAFCALGQGRDGLVTTRDVVPLFGELPDGMPHFKPFGLDEWRRAMLGHAEGLQNTKLLGSGDSDWAPQEQQICHGLDLLGVFLGFGTCRAEVLVNKDCEWDRDESVGRPLFDTFPSTSQSHHRTQPSGKDAWDVNNEHVQQFYDW